MATTDTAIELLDFHPTVDDLGEEILNGLRAPQKRMSPKYFYDRRGSQLFDQITRLPEYYPTRAEVEIMERYIDEMTAMIGPQASLIELGSGSSEKTHILLRHLEELAAYVPVDISKTHLMEAAEGIAAQYPDMEVLPVCADFTQSFGLPRPQVMPLTNVVYFPGSTIGNFSPEFAGRLLGVIAQIAKHDGVALIGVDMKKDAATLERAYNDAAGVTAAFNLNMLVRMNRELDANFDLDNFEHRAVYNQEMGRIEMHLVSTVAQQVTVSGETIAFDAGEYILTECSHKYTPEEFAELAAPAGLEVRKVWTDSDRLFSVQYLVAN